MTDLASTAKDAFDTYATVSSSDSEAVRDAGYDLAKAVVSIARAVDRLADRIDALADPLPRLHASTLDDMAETWDTTSHTDTHALKRMIGDLHSVVEILADRLDPQQPR